MKNLMGQIKNEIEKALEYTSNASIYSAEETVPELTSAQISVLTLFYGLLVGDLTLCASVVQFQIPQLRSSFLRVWLADDFFFSRHDVGMVLSMLSFLMSRKDVLIPIHILTIFGGLVQKYGVADCCSKELLDVLNEGQEATNDSSTSPSIFRRMGSLKLKIFQRNSRTRTEKIEPFEVIKKEQCENTDNSRHPDHLDMYQNISPCNEVIEESLNKINRTNQNVPQPKKRQTLPNKTVSVDSKGRTALHRLAGIGLADGVFRHLQEGLDPNKKDFSGKTPLHYAVEFGDLATIEVLLKARALVNVRTNTGETPLSIAREKVQQNPEYVKIIEILLKYEAFQELGLSPQSFNTFI